MYVQVTRGESEVSFFKKMCIKDIKNEDSIF